MREGSQPTKIMNPVHYLFAKPVKSKSKLALLVLAILLTVLNVLVYFDCGIYQAPIAKVSSAELGHTKTVSGELHMKETQYDQILTCILQNGSDQGRTVRITNTYTDTRMKDSAYHKGDFLFVDNVKAGGSGTLTATISGQKRDYFLSFLLSLLLFGAVAIAGKRGFAFIVALGLNIGILILAFFSFQTGVSFILLTIMLILLFSALSLGICIGLNRQMLVALVDTLVCISVLAALYCLTLKIAPAVDYTRLDYIRSSVIHLEVIFTCGTLLGSLGAIMDVAVSITSGVAEILKKSPAVSDQSLSKSVRQMGFDVMGTMINVLFYTYLVGRIPICLAQLANGMQFSVMFQYYMVYEFLRFLAGALGIVLCIPVSGFIAKRFYRKKAS